MKIKSILLTISLLVASSSLVAQTKIVINDATGKVKSAGLLYDSSKKEPLLLEMENKFDFPLSRINVLVLNDAQDNELAVIRLAHGNNSVYILDTTEKAFQALITTKNGNKFEYQEVPLKLSKNGGKEAVVNLEKPLYSITLQGAPSKGISPVLTQVTFNEINVGPAPVQMPVVEPYLKGFNPKTMNEDAEFILE